MDEWSTRRGREARAAYRAECEERNAPCWLCGQPIDYGAISGTPNAFELDHRLPRADYPELTFEPSNFAPAHSSCNRARGKKDVPLPLGPLTAAW